ncbi:MAG: hypothetical protein IIC40_05160 [Candidatus Marinimicrobia bacterium]|nr:hypothetical protein [Candidatus Neomarinimicrobiota bacterium]
MKMTTTKFILLRIYNVTFGRFAIFASLLRRILVKVLITSKADEKYVTSSKFYTHKDLD